MIQRKLLYVGFALLASTAQAANSGISYEGQILKPDGTPLSGAAAQFKLQIRTPGSEDCLMYEEIQTLNMSSSGGSFSLTLNDGSGSRTDTTGLTLDRIFANRGAFTFNPSTCTSGSGYTPALGDGRHLVVLFKDETMATWEPIPAETINYVPFALESKQVAGFGADSLLRVVDGSGDPLTGLAPLSNAQYTALMDLVNGSSAAYTKAGQLNGVALPTMAAGESLGWNGTAWVSQPSATGPNSITTTMIQSGAVSGTKLDPAISISTSGTIASAITTTRDFKIYNATNQYVEMVANNAITGTTDVDGHVFYKLTWPAGAASTNGQVLTSDTSGNLTWTTPSSAGITTLTGDVTATGPGSAAATVLSVGGSPAAQIHQSQLDTAAATSVNAPNTIVKRDGTGSLAVGDITSSNVKLNNAGSILNIVNPIGGAWTMTLPATAGSSGQVLTTNGSGGLSWSTAGGGSQWANNGSDISYISGNVGIGTAAPSAKLEVVGGGIKADTFQANSTGTIGSACSPNGQIANSVSVGGLVVCTSGTWKMPGPWDISSGVYYTPTGNKISLGAGISGVSTAVHVKNNVAPSYSVMRIEAMSGQTAPLMEVVDAGGSNAKFLLTADGKVGIGTTAPKSTLEVNGGLARRFTTSTSATYVVSDFDTHILMNPPAAAVVTLPSASLFPGREISIRNISGYAITSDSSNVASMNSANSTNAILPSALPGKWVLLVSDGVSWQIQMGN